MAKAALLGSEKQVEWAKKIRKQRLMALDGLLERQAYLKKGADLEKTQAALEAIKTALEGVASCKLWIDMRDDLPALVRTVLPEAADFFDAFFQ